ncbi:MAG: hypothetical protein RLZZ117_567 [Cyanobacteriota bacterium]
MPVKSGWNAQPCWGRDDPHEQPVDPARQEAVPERGRANPERARPSRAAVAVVSARDRCGADRGVDRSRTHRPPDRRNGRHHVGVDILAAFRPDNHPSAVVAAAAVLAIPPTATPHQVFQPQPQPPDQRDRPESSSRAPSSSLRSLTNPAAGAPHSGCCPGPSDGGLDF